MEDRQRADAKLRKAAKERREKGQERGERRAERRAERGER